MLLKSAIAFTDSDFDGVEDSIDRCPDTPFDVLVDQYGCPIENEEQSSGWFSAKVGGSYYTDEEDETSYASVYLSYGYKSWYFSLSSNYYIYDSFYKKGGMGSSYISGSYTFSTENLDITPGLTIKIPTAKKEFGSKNVDLLPSIDADFYIGNFDIFAYYGLIFRGRSSDNQYSASVGAGYQFNDSIYLSGSYDFDEDNSKYLSAFSVFDITDKYFLTLSYSYGLNKKAIDNYFSSQFGVRF